MRNGFGVGEIEIDVSLLLLKAVSIGTLLPALGM